MKKSKKYFIHNYEPSNPIKDFDYCSIKKFAKLKHNSINECFIADLLDNMIENNKEQFIGDLKKKLSVGGCVYIQSLDRYASAAAILNKQVDSRFFNKLLFLNSRKELSCMSETMALLKKHGFDIDQSKFINGIQYFIKATKNNE